MARWDDERRWGEGDAWWTSRRGDEWRASDRDPDGGPNDRERWRDEWPPRDTWRGREERDDWRRDRGGGRSAMGASGRDMPPRGEPYRRGDDYGAREYGASEVDWTRYGTEWPGRDERGRGSGWRDRDARGARGQRFGSRWGGGDYTTYGQSGFDESERAAWMNEDLRREQGRGWRPHEGGGEWLGGGRGGGHGPLERLGDRFREGLDKLRGRGPKGYRRSDERIHEEICERIARSGIDAEDVEVRVEKAEVTLTGTTGSRHDKRMLEDLADEVFGVEEVQNQLRVRRETGTGATMGATGATAGGQGTQPQSPQAAHRQQPPASRPDARH